MADESKKDYGVLAEYPDTTALVRACEKVRDAGYTKWDSYSPFPVHGIDPAMGIKPTILPWFIFGMGITGTITAIVLQWWMNAYDYVYLISGKPDWSIPANVPVMFELTVLFAGLTTFFGHLVFNGLPNYYHPLFKAKRFARATNDKFFICIEAADPKYDPQRTIEFLKGTNCAAIETVEDDSEVNAAIPSPILYIAAVGFVVGLIPLAGIIHGRISHGENRIGAQVAKAAFGIENYTRIHPNPNMDHQKKFKTQTPNNIEVYLRDSGDVWCNPVDGICEPKSTSVAVVRDGKPMKLFADGRAMRPLIEDTVAQGDGKLDDHYYRGIVDGQWAESFPEGVTLTTALVDRGEQRYVINCAPCHGAAGYGDGMVHREATEHGHTMWVPPTSLHLDYLRVQPHGKIFNTITNGIRNMPAYGHAIPEADRWAIVAYIRALQRSQYAKLNDVEDTKRSKLQ